MNSRPMLNAYPDSIGSNMTDCLEVLKLSEMKDMFGSFYILPSIFNTDLDRGFSVIDYGINELMAKREEIEELKAMDIDLKFDFILNHCSVLSKQFQDIIQNGEQSKYKDFFINWNRFWEGNGEMTEEGYIQPDQELIKNMFFRKPGLPILMVRMPDGNEVPYWNTFYQEVKYSSPDALDIMNHLDIQYASACELADIITKAISAGLKPAQINYGRYERYRSEVIDLLESERKYLGQMDINIKSPLVWEYYDDVLKTLAGYGAGIVRLDAFAYAPKEPGEKNFLNDPGTWNLLKDVSKLADKYSLSLLPEIHAAYSEKTYELVADKGYMTYDFFLPGLIIDAIEKKNGKVLIDWANELVDKNIHVVNMLGCHDGIPLLDLKGLIPDSEIESLIDTVVSRGGYVKNLHGQKNMYYQVNATYYSALGEDDRKMLLARAIQMFMPGKPQIWYLDIFAGTNDHDAVKRAGEGGHKEINRTNLSVEDIKKRLELDVVKGQIDLIRFRNTFPAFGFDAEFSTECDGNRLTMRWEKNGYSAVLNADLDKYSYIIDKYTIN